MTGPTPDAEGNGGIAAAEHELAVHRHLMRFGEAESRVAPVWTSAGTSVAAVAVWVGSEPARHTAAV